MANILQINLNRTWRAQDLMTQTVAESSTALCLVSEPAGIPVSSRWFASTDKLSAVYVEGLVTTGLVTLLTQGVRCVAIKLRRMTFISCYVSPNVSLPDYREFLDELSGVIACVRNSDVLLAGDFNAKSSYWGFATTSPRGELLDNWAAGLDLRLVNVGHAPTCVRQQGSSVVDLTWASAGLMKRISNWRVREDFES